MIYHNKALLLTIKKNKNSHLPHSNNLCLFTFNDFFLTNQHGGIGMLHSHKCANSWPWLRFDQ